MHKEIIAGIIIIIFCVILFSFKAGDISSQFTGDENFYFKSSENMLRSGDWLTPRYYGKARFQKPILYYWLVLVFFKIFGINWYAARFPSILFAVLTSLLLYLIGKKLFKSTSISLLSMLILATTFKFFKYARFAIPDMALLFFITLSFYIFIELFENNKRFLWMAFFLSLALGTLTKGPIGIIIPLLSIALFKFFSKERLAIRKGDIFLGVLLYIVVVLPWFLIMFKLHGNDFISQVWLREIAHRVGYYSDTKEGLSRLIEYLKTLFFYIPILFIRFLPWSVFLPKGLFNSISIARSNLEDKRGHIFLLSWFFSVFMFFTFIGEKHSQYMLALSPAFALIVGSDLALGIKFKRKSLTAPIILAVITAISFLYFLSNEEFRLNNAILGGFAMRISTYGLDEDDKIGMGSHGLIPQQLEAYLDRPVEKVGGKWYDPVYHEEMNRLQLENFFKDKKRVFCIIRKEDFQRYVSPEIREGLKIVYRDFLWRRKIEITKGKLSLLFKGRINAFLDSFREEYYLITNR